MSEIGGLSVSVSVVSIISLIYRLRHWLYLRYLEKNKSKLMKLIAKETEIMILEMSNKLNKINKCYEKVKNYERRIAQMDNKRIKFDDAISSK